MIVHKNGKTYTIDVVISKEGSATEGSKDRLNAAYNYKINKYSEYQKKNPAHIIFPFAMSVHGIYHEKTITHLDDLARSMRIDTEFRTDVLRHTQIALQKATHEFFSYKKTMLICMSSALSSTLATPAPPVILTQSEQQPPSATSTVPPMLGKAQEKAIGKKGVKKT